MIGWIRIFIGVLFFSGCQQAMDKEETQMVSITNLPYYNSPDFEPYWTENEGTKHYIEPFEFTDQNGQKINDETFKDKIYITNFFFTSCGSICPKMMKHMNYLQDELSEFEDVHFLSHTVLPEVDSVPKLKEYTQNYNLNERVWHLVTGNKSDLYRLARQSYFVEEEIGFTKDSSEFLHTEHFVLIDKSKRIRGVYNGTIRLEMDRILEDVAILMKEDN
jgi:protein SCO1/2